jgi:hypothetical protein
MLEEIPAQARRLTENQQRRLVADLQGDNVTHPSEARREMPGNVGLLAQAAAMLMPAISQVARTNTWPRYTRRSREAGVFQHQRESPPPPFDCDADDLDEDVSQLRAVAVLSLLLSFVADRARRMAAENPHGRPHQTTRRRLAS